MRRDHKLSDAQQYASVLDAPTGVKQVHARSELRLEEGDLETSESTTESYEHFIGFWFL